MTVAIDTETSMAEFGKEEKTVLPSTYGCEILLEKTTIAQAKIGRAHV